jgi:NAD(P)-dependent dehydrogenase (short-subunit alcohol dehydrogenase family)
MSKLDGKTAVITGATSGMGLAAARLLATEGAHVYITGRRKELLDQAVRVISGATPGAVTGVRADSGRSEDLARLFDTVRSGHGRGDVLYASAASAR